MNKFIYGLILALNINFVSQAMQVTISDKSNKEKKSLAVVKAAREGDTALFYQLFSEDIEKEIDVNQQDERGATALHYATLHGAIAIFNKLANSPGINANVQDNDGVTPLRIAVADRSVLCILALLELNADPDIKDKTGVSAADNAKQSADCTEIDRLFERIKKIRKIPNKVREQIIKVIEILLPNAKIYLFESRAEGTNHQESDIDIAIDADRIMTITEKEQINSMINVLNIVQKINVVDFNNIPEDIKNDILKEGIMLKS